MSNLTNTPTYIVEALGERGVEVEVLDDESSFIRYRQPGSRWRYLRSCVTDTTSAVGRYVCDDKHLSHLVAQEIGMPIPPSLTCTDLTDTALTFMAEHAPLVVKPLTAAHGHGITFNVSDEAKLRTAFDKALARDATGHVQLQRTVGGKDLRLLVIGYRFVAAIRRVPACVSGDGCSTIKQLIEIENCRPERSAGKRGELAVIDVATAQEYLGERTHEVPPKGKTVQVIGSANTSLGGWAEDFTDKVSADMAAKAEAFARDLRLDVCAVDLLHETDEQFFFIEANASPGFGPHMHPRVGQKHDVVTAFVDMLLSGEHKR